METLDHPRKKADCTSGRFDITSSSNIKLHIWRRKKEKNCIGISD
jgi:hypothetical protein